MNGGSQDSDNILTPPRFSGRLQRYRRHLATPPRRTTSPTVGGACSRPPTATSTTYENGMIRRRGGWWRTAGEADGWTRRGRFGRELEGRAAKETRLPGGPGLTRLVRLRFVLQFQGDRHHPLLACFWLMT
jgi:hypothetical protein